MILAVDRRLVLLAAMIWSMPDDAPGGQLKARILASDALAGRAVPQDPVPCTEVA